MQIMNWLVFFHVKKVGPKQVPFGSFYVPFGNFLDGLLNGKITSPDVGNAQTIKRLNNQSYQSASILAYMAIKQAQGVSSLPLLSFFFA